MAAAEGATDSWSHAILINAHATVGDGDGALSALAAMRRAGYRPCVMSYTAALKAPCAVGDLDLARQILGEMERDFEEAAAAAAAKGKGKGAGKGKGGKGGKGKGGAQGEGKTKSFLDDWTPNVRTANTFFRGCLVAGGAF